ncbi:MAG: patatin family protein [Clostridia bacterium]|nr:patatin family protein [Clostridia bacterium]
MKTGIIDVGGGLRGVYGAGVLDRCLDNGISFDVCIGVSSGSANVTAFVAAQKGRNHTFYTDYPFRKEYMSVRNFLKTGSYLNLDYIYGTLSNSDGENPLNFEKFKSSASDVFVVSTNAQTGEAKYFTKDDFLSDDYSVLKASCAIPGVCKPVKIGAQQYFDGALSDAVPVEKAFSEGCDRVVLILNKPRDLTALTKNDFPLSKIIEKNYPAAARALRAHALEYNLGVELAKKNEKSGRLLIVSPDSVGEMKTLSKNRAALESLYEKGYSDASVIPDFIKSR